MIFCTSSTEGVVELFDEQFIDLCQGTGTIPATEWVDWQNPSPELYACLDLGTYYHIDYFQLFDSWGAGNFRIEWATQPDCEWFPVLTYFTSANQEWITLANFQQPSHGIRFLRFVNEGQFGQHAKIGELFICGKPVQGGTPLTPPGKFSTRSVKCEDALFQWNYCISQGQDLQFEVWYALGQNPNPEVFVQNVPGVQGNQTYTLYVDELLCGTAYRFFIRTVDNTTGAVSAWTYVDIQTIGCDGCHQKCECEMVQLTPSMFWDYDRNSEQIIGSANYANGAAALGNEQSISDNPFCRLGGQPQLTWSAPSGDQPKYAMIDLGQEYEIGSMAIYDDNGRGAIHIAAGQPGNFGNFLFHRSQHERYTGWFSWENLDLSTRYLLIKKEGLSPKFNELRICKRIDEIGERAEKKGQISEKPGILGEIHLFPNPANTALNVLLPTATYKEARIVSIHGEVFDQVLIPVGEQRISINTSNLSDGMYLLELKNEDGLQIFKRFIVLK